MSAYLNLPDGQIVPVRDGLVLGRVAGCDVVVDDSKASRRHACLRVEGGVVEIEDLGSSNGTLLNGKPVQRRLLRDGDQVQIGATVIVFRAGQPGASPAPSAPAVDDDVDLFGGDAPAAPPPPAPLPAGPRSQPPPSAPTSAPAGPSAGSRAGSVPTFQQPASPQAASPPPVSSPTGPPPISPPPISSPPISSQPVSSPPVSSPKGPPPRVPPARPDLVEFADEVVEVRSTPRSAALPPPAPAGPPRIGDATSIVQQVKRPLQYARQPERRGAMGDDIGQLSGGARLLVVVGVLAGAAGLAWLAMTLVS